jgi:hypothetical protein
MTIQSVIKEVCSFVGVRPPQGSVIQNPLVDRTSWEFVNLANEMAQRIGYDTRDWTTLRKLCIFPGDGVVASFSMPSDYQRMLLTSNVWRSSNVTTPLSFIPDPDEWTRKEMQGHTIPTGEWIITGDEMFIRPTLAAGETAKFWYLRNTPVRLNSGGFGKEFVNDADAFVLQERLLKLAMIWQWKAHKGATYAEDLANYEDALAKVAGADKPSPILVDGPVNTAIDYAILY